MSLSSHATDARPPNRVAGRRLASLALVALGLLLSVATDPDSATFPAFLDVQFAIFYLVIGIVYAGVIGLLSLWRGVPTALRLAALGTLPFGLFFIIALGGLLTWVAPLLLIAADVWANGERRVPVWPLLIVVAIAVTAAGAYGLFSPNSPSAFVGGAVLWLVPLPYFFIREVRHHEWEAGRRS